MLSSSCRFCECPVYHVDGQWIHCEHRKDVLCCYPVVGELREVEFYVAIDFDDTIAEGRYPEIGKEVPGAVEWVKKIQARCGWILLTMRCGEHLKRAVDWLAERGLDPWAINFSPGQATWSRSRKVYAHLYIDDCGLGIPTTRYLFAKASSDNGGIDHWRDYVDWSRAGPMAMDKIGEVC